MSHLTSRDLARASLLLLPLLVHQAWAAPADTGTDAAAPTPQEIDIVGRRQTLDAARNGLSPDTGSSVYRFDPQDLQRLPLGDSTPLNQVVLQAPGVVQDSYGQLHVRGDHANLQYRVDGILIPEAISGFGQALSTRIADRLNVLTGALPAQYGYRTAAVVDLHTRSPADGHEGTLDLQAGSFGRRQAELDLSGASGALSYGLVGAYQTDQLGIENPTPSRNALHDDSHQARGFGYLSWLLGNGGRLGAMLGATDNRFQIPDVPGQTPSYTLAGVGTVDSATLDARQRERNGFAALSYQASLGTALDYQVALVHRVTDVHYQPDAVGDLVFNGIAADILRRNTADSLQADLSWAAAPQHTVRGGLFVQRERYLVNNSSQVFPADADGNQTSDVPITIADDTRLAGHLWGAYVQDEWQPFKGLTINYGARWDQVATVSDEHQLSPRLGLVYDLSPTLRLHAGYARYFTPPPTEKIDTTSVQKFLGTTNALPSDANTAVRSERSNYFDAGLSWQADAAWTLGVDAYYRDVRHLQDEGQFGNALLFSAFNYAQGRIYGIELTGNYRSGAWAGYANLAFGRALGRGIETGQFNFEQDELDYIASHWVHLDHDQSATGSAGLSYRWADGTQLSGDALYGTGLRDGFANSGHLPGYAQVNLALTRPLDLPGLGRIEGRLAVLNLFDRVYELRDGTGIGVGAPQYGTRRAFELGLSKHF